MDFLKSETAQLHREIKPDSAGGSQNDGGVNGDVTDHLDVEVVLSLIQITE